MAVNRVEITPGVPRHGPFQHLLANSRLSEVNSETSALEINAVGGQEFVETGFRQPLDQNTAVF